MVSLFISIGRHTHSIISGNNRDKNNFLKTVPETLIYFHYSK